MTAFHADRVVDMKHFHMFCGLGGGAKGMNRGTARVGHLVARMRCIGGIDSAAAAVADFERITGARGTVRDLFSREQYEAFHGRPVPADWEEATAETIRAAAGGERPDIVFFSAPCKGFSGLLSQERSLSIKYQTLNQLALRGLFLVLEAFKDHPDGPIPFILFENVPRVQTRGREILDTIIRILELYGYAAAETTHDCGELGGLGQSRKRFLLVSRHREQVPPFLYEPHKRKLRSVGEVLGAFPLPGDEAAGPMHRMRRLQWKTWVRLAFVEAGGDWRSLKRLRVADGHLTDFGIVPEREWYRGALGVLPWDASVGTITGEPSPTNGRFSVADPRMQSEFEYAVYGVKKWGDTSSTVTGKAAPGSGYFSVADPRLDEENGKRFNNVFRVVEWGKPAGAVTAGGGNAAAAVADPRAREASLGFKKYKVCRFDEPAPTVIAASTTGQGAFAVADPRPATEYQRQNGSGFPYGVVPWDRHAGAVSGAGSHDNGSYSVADPRCAAADTSVLAIIRSLDGTWHRPFTTFELAALQSLVLPGEDFVLAGKSDSDWRERIGNAVPPDAAEAIASVMAHTWLLTLSGETFALGSTPIWVRPIAIALSVSQPEATL